MVRKATAQPKPNKLGKCMACTGTVYDAGEKIGKKYGHGYIHDECYNRQRREVERWNEDARK